MTSSILSNLPAWLVNDMQKEHLSYVQWVAWYSLLVGW